MIELLLLDSFLCGYLIQFGYFENGYFIQINGSVFASIDIEDNYICNYLLIHFLFISFKKYNIVFKVIVFYYK